jgi:hypothetical protein
LKRDAISTWWVNFAEQTYNYTLDNDVSDGQSDDDSDEAEATY